MRHHGWELPYHPLQITAVAGFLALVFAFYIFFLPFVEFDSLKICGLTAYSCMVMVVCVLYVWCVATDPADIQVLGFKNRISSSKGNVDLTRRPLRLHTEAEERRCLFHFLPLVLPPKVDCCLGHACVKKSASPENSMLYCSLCNVEISIYSKHCRVCDKCVDGFDHHCRWLNNCVGKRNYAGFVILMVSALIMFILQWSFGLWILVHRLLNGKHFESIIVLKLGRSFPAVVYLLVLVLSTVLAMAATYPLGQLTYFHVLLIQKGITTYEFIMAKRNQELKAENELPSRSLAPSASSLAISSCSKVQEDQEGQGSPRLMCDHEQGDPGGESSDFKQDKDQGGSWKTFSQRFSMRKASMKINPWNLAFASPDYNAHVGSTSTSTFSALQPKAVVGELESSFNSSQGFGADFIASLGNGSVSRKESHSNLVDHSIVSIWQNGKLPLESFDQIDSSENDSGTLSHPLERDKMLTPLQREARNVFRSSHAFCTSGVSSPSDRAGTGLDSKVCDAV